MPITTHANVPAARATGATVAASLVVCFVFMPWIYLLVAFGPTVGPLWKREVLEHIGMECSANAVVMLSAIRLTARFDRRLAQIILRTLAAHGALAFITLIFRHFYSIPMMLVGAMMSLVLGIAVTRFRQVTGRARVGVLGPWHPIVDDQNLICNVIRDPDVSLAAYDFLVLTFPGQPPARWVKTVSRALLAGKRVRHISEFIEEAQGFVAIEHFHTDHLPTGGLTSYVARKRLLDIVLALICLPLALPLVGAAVIAIRLSMGRPVLYRQRRVGQHGRAYEILKLRTMRSEATSTEANTTSLTDPRITPLGRWLRHYHIDEVPQLWNVLAGDMSLVGPRPEWTALVDTYVREVPAYAYRHLLRPGITGWAQVRAGYAADINDTRVKVSYDLYYLKNFSFSLDVQILLLTLWDVLRGRGGR